MGQFTTGLGAGVTVTTAGVNLVFPQGVKKLTITNEDATNPVYVVVGGVVGTFAGNVPSGAFTAGTSFVGTTPPTDLTVSKFTAAAVVARGYKLLKGQSRDFTGPAPCVALVSTGGSVVVSGGETDLSPTES